MNGESKWWQFRSHHPKNEPRTKDDEEEDWDTTLSGYCDSTPKVRNIYVSGVVIQNRTHCAKHTRPRGR